MIWAWLVTYDSHLVTPCVVCLASLCASGFAVLTEQNQHIEQLTSTINAHQAEVRAVRDEIAAKMSQIAELERILPQAGVYQAKVGGGGVAFTVPPPPPVPHPQPYQNQALQQQQQQHSSSDHMTAAQVAAAMAGGVHDAQSATMMQLILRDQECVQLRQKVRAQHRAKKNTRQVLCVFDLSLARVFCFFVTFVYSSRCPS